jgi:predicted CXXCH cytochrome family protein
MGTLNLHITGGVLAVLALSGGVASATPVVIEMRQGVQFRHMAHMPLVGSCLKCHEKGPGKIQGFGREWAHAVCKGCHAETDNAPYHCAGCHDWHEQDNAASRGRQ